MRLFVALDIPEEAASYLEQVQSSLRQEVKADRWQSLHNLHLTLHFLGEVKEALIQAIQEDMDIVSAITKPFRLRMGNLGAFPNEHRPRVLWMGLRGHTEALKQLHLLLGRRFELHPGLAFDRREYSPHITLARGPKSDREGLPLADWDERLLQDEPPHWQVNHIHLYQSELKHEGAVHTIIHTSTFEKDHSKKQAVLE